MPRRIEAVLAAGGGQTQTLHALVITFNPIIFETLLNLCG
jgi:hypothetical protein